VNLSLLAGNERVKEQLSQQERGRGLSHAYYFRAGRFGKAHIGEFAGKSYALHVQIRETLRTVRTLPEGGKGDASGCVHHHRAGGG